MNFTCNECNDSGSRDKLGTYLDCNACGTAATRRDLNDFVKSLGPTHPEDVALAIHQRALAMAPKQEAPRQWVAVKDSAWVNIVNHDRAYDGWDKDDIINHVFKLTEAKCKELNGPGAAPAAANVAPESQPLIGKIMDRFSELPVLWGLNEPGALLRHSDVFRMLVDVNREQPAAAGPDAALIESLEVLLGLVDEFGIKSGVCCCGDDMARHSNPMDCGHSPVDSGEYYSAKTIEVARAALSGAKGN